MQTMQDKIKKLKKEKNAVILSHTYQPAEVQDCADYVGDSYGLSVQASKVTDADTIIFAGVRFMAETAYMLNPAKRVVMPVENAGCPMADMITPDELRACKNRNPDYLVMCYVNSTAEIKAMADVCCTSSNALSIAQQIPLERGIIFVPDKHLGSWVQEQTGHTMVLWDGFCPTHVRITPAMVGAARSLHPGAIILMHPEAPKASRALADAILSTGGMIDFVKKRPEREFIIATETGILHTLKQRAPDTMFYPVSESSVCPNMKKGSLESLLRALEGTGGIVVTVPEAVAAKAVQSLKKMLVMAGK
jgi:quinolinate synthase